ncbi:MAG: hypothetical protein M0P58_07290 [Bacteroidales bacterium]|nr:hypothetical protein [Bacteroidales bacterium]
MKKHPGLSLFFIILFTGAHSQDTLFDDTRVSSVYIDIPSDSLSYIMKNVLSGHYFMARFIFDDYTCRDTLENINFRLRGITSRYSLKKYRLK